MINPISHLRDSFDNNTIDPAWAASVAGSATVAETGGQAVLTLPNAIAGSHLAKYTSNGTYDLTADGFVWNIATMLATGVAASAFFQLLVDATGANQLYWRQVSNAITARMVVAGVDSQLFTATWSSTTYRYLRIRESGGTIFFDSSSNGTTFTNRASVANPFAITSLFVQFAVSGGNIASPGSLKLDDANLILPALSSNWRYVTCERPSTDYHRSNTLATALPNTAQGCIMTCESIDASLNPVNPRWFAGPLGSASGGYNQLVEYSSLASAQSNAVNIPGGYLGRWDLPVTVQCRIVRLYMRSITGSSFGLGEFYPRRLVQTDDIEAESIKAINIAANTITADKITVLNLAALSAQMGALHMDGVIDIASVGGIYQGSGSFASPTTGLKLFNSGGVGKLSGYNAGVEQISLDTDGKLKAGNGNVILDSTGLALIRAASGYVSNNAISWYDTTSYTNLNADISAYGVSGGTELSLRSENGSNPNTILLTASRITSAGIKVTGDVSTTTKVEVQTNGVTKLAVDNIGSLHVMRSSGTAQFAMDATDLGASITIANNASTAPLGGVRNFSGVLIISETAVSGNCAMFIVDGGGNITLLGAAGASWSVTSGTAGKSNVFLTSGVISIENKLGSTATYNILSLRTRTS